MFNRGVKLMVIHVAIITILLIHHGVISDDDGAPASDKDEAPLPDNDGAPTPARDAKDEAPAPSKDAKDGAPSPAKDDKDGAPSPAKDAKDGAPAPAKDAKDGASAPANDGAPASSKDWQPIPADKSQINSWFDANVKPYTEKKDSLDPVLAAAEAEARVVKVRKDGSGDFKTITEAVNSIPSGNSKRVIVWIGEGEYQEKIKIDKTKKFVTLYGSPDAMPNVTFGGTAAQYGTFDSATIIVESEYFMAANIRILNSSPRPDGKRVGAQAVALRISGDKAAFYNCKVFGFQDTLCDDKGNHFFKDCYVEGTVDFIFGEGKSLYLNTQLHVLGDNQLTVITAHGRENDKDDTGYSFVHCSITGTGNGTYLGRAWRTSPRVVYAYTDMSKVVKPAGWSHNFHPEREKTVFYGEYKCSGGGATSDERAKFTKHLTDKEVEAFLNLGYIIRGKMWLLPPPAKL